MSILGKIQRIVRFKIFSISNIKIKHLDVGIPLSAKLKTDRSSFIEFQDYCNVGRYSTILALLNSNIKIGKDFHLGDFSIIQCVDAQVIIGDNCMIGSHAQLISTNHNYLSKNILIKDQGMGGVSKKGIKIGNDCWIGSGACILPGVNIGNGVVVGAMSVVTKDISPYSIVVGNPAKVIKVRE
ncbi:MAG: acyltransferase [Nostoc sp.]|uniref:acyltransferase n=1 Tax=Nostoc sp. TaxID=1180 RepID=UPI002FF40463